MAEDFDGYRKWLGITSKQRPPAHYDLLGIKLDEDDQEVIQAAIEQRRSFVESKRGLGHDSVVNEILYRIGEAEVTLLNPELRRDYDHEQELFNKRRKNRQVDPKASRSRVKSRPGKTVGEDGGIVKTFVGIMAVVCIGFGIMAWFSSQLPWSKRSGQGIAAQNAQVPNPAPVLAQNEAVNVPAVERKPARKVSPPFDGGVDQEVTLFNGTDLIGWTVLTHKETKDPTKKTWIADPDRKVLASLGEEFNELRTAGKYDNFRLNLEWRFTPGRIVSPNGSGVIIRSNGLDTRESNPRGIEIDLREEPQDPNGMHPGNFIAYNTSIKNLDGETQGEFGEGKPPRRLKRLKKPELRTSGQWNTTTITCQGDRIKVEMNGELINEGWGVPVDAGHICLRNQNTSIEFRNITIVPMSLQRDVIQTSPVANTELSHWKFWDVFNGKATKEFIVVSRDGVLVSPAGEKGFCLSTLQQFSSLELRIEYQLQRGDNIGNVFVAIGSTLPNPPPATDDWTKKIPYGVEVKLAPQIAGEFVLPSDQYAAKLVDGQQREGRHVRLLKPTETKIGEWNTLEIKVDDDRKMFAKINGVLVNRLEDMQNIKGHVVIWFPLCEMRLRNAVAISGGRETKLSFDILE